MTSEQCAVILTTSRPWRRWNILMATMEAARWLLAVGLLRHAAASSAAPEMSRIGCQK